MEHDTYELFLRECKTQQKASEEIKVSQSSISKMRSGERPIAFNTAERITSYLMKKTGLIISPESLITSIEKKKRKFSQSTLFNDLPIQISSIYLEKITNKFDEKSYLINPKKVPEKLIIIDEFYYLILDEETYFYYLKHNKKIVEGCKINLQELVNRGLNKSIIAYISEKFDLIERTKLAQRVENLAGNRRGKPSKKCSNVDNYPHLTLPSGVRARDFVAQFFGLGSAFSYRMLKRIISHGDEKLIGKVRHEEITPHAAYQSILNTQPKPSFSIRSLFNFQTRR